MEERAGGEEEKERKAGEKELIMTTNTAHHLFGKIPVTKTQDLLSRNRATALA